MSVLILRLVRFLCRFQELFYSYHMIFFLFLMYAYSRTYLKESEISISTWNITNGLNCRIHMLYLDDFTGSMTVDH